jgi:hypothetical protein
VLGTLEEAGRVSLWISGKIGSRLRSESRPVYRCSVSAVRQMGETIQHLSGLIAYAYREYAAGDFFVEMFFVVTLWKF